MALLFSNEILNAVNKELQSANESVQIITAYCKEDSIKKIVEEINPSVREKKLMIRFRLDDLIKGSTDFGVIKYCKDEGWEVFVRFDLHAKTYIVDNKRGIVGSANTTKRGLSIGIAGNVEMATLVDIESQDIDKINKLYRDAIVVDENVYNMMKNQYEAAVRTSDGGSLFWNNNIAGLFNPHVDYLFSHELPDTDALIEGMYISFLDIACTSDKSVIKEALRWSNAYIWLQTILKENGGCLYFGFLSEKLHNALVNDPKPYRKDVKKLLANLLSIVSELNMEEIEIDRPNYSQRIQLR